MNLRNIPRHRVRKVIISSLLRVNSPTSDELPRNSNSSRFTRIKVPNIGTNVPIRGKHSILTPDQSGTERKRTVRSGSDLLEVRRKPATGPSNARRRRRQRRGLQGSPG